MTSSAFSTNLDAALNGNARKTARAPGRSRNGVVFPGERGSVSKQLEPAFLASCPFCEYRELFSSVVTMSATYCAHLLDHEGEAVAESRLGRKGAAKRMERVVRHLQRLNTAQYN